MDTHTLARPLTFGIQTPNVWATLFGGGCGLPCSGGALLGWGSGLPCLGVAPPIGDTDSHPLVWPLELGIWTPTLWCGPLSLGHGLPGLGTTPQVGGTVSHALAWPIRLVMWTPTLSLGPTNGVYKLLHFGVAS